MSALDGRAAALSPTLRAWSIKGLEGGDSVAEAQRVTGEMKSIEDALQPIEADIGQAEAEDQPAPMAGGF